jgi:hypothetical protein
MQEENLEPRNKKKTLKLGGPDEKGIAVTWSIPKAAGAYLDKTVYIRMDAVVGFSETQTHFDIEPSLDFSPRGEHSDFLKKYFTFERLATIRQSGDGLQRLKDAFVQMLVNQPDPNLVKFNDERLAWIARRSLLPAPGSVNNAGITEKNKKDYENAIAQMNVKIEEILEKIKTRLDDNKTRSENKADIIFSDERWQTWFGMITVRITKCEAIARDPRGNEYVVPIVAPGGD